MIMTAYLSRGHPHRLLSKQTHKREQVSASDESNENAEIGNVSLIFSFFVFFSVFYGVCGERGNGIGGWGMGMGWR